MTTSVLILNQIKLSEKMQTNNSTSMNVLHSHSPEEMTTLESLETSISFNKSKNTALAKKWFHEAIVHLFPRLSSMDPHPPVISKYIPNPLNILPTSTYPISYPNITSHTTNDEAFLA